MVVAKDAIVDPDCAMRSLMGFAEGASNPVPVPVEGTNRTITQTVGKIDMNLVPALDTDGDGIEAIPMDTGRDEVASPTTDKGDTEDGEEVGDFTRIVNPSLVVEVALEEVEDGGDEFHNRKETTLDYL